MMECPRCGFVQPEDQFCANCGLNISHFQAPPKPLGSRVFTQSFLYGGLAFAASYLLFYSIKHVDPPTKKEKNIIVNEHVPIKVQDASSAISPSEPKRLDSPAPPVEASEITKKIEQDTSTPPSPPTSTSEFRGMSQSAPSQSTSEPQSSSGAQNPTELPAKMVQQLDFQFYEIERENLSLLTQNAKILAEGPTWKAFQILQKEKWLKISSEVRRLPGQRQMSSHPSTTSMLHYPAAPTGVGQMPLGLFLDIAVVKLDANQIELDVSGHFGLKPQTGAESRGRIELSLNYSPQNLVILSGVLPHRLGSLAPQQQIQNSPLAILESLDFIENRSEFILLIQGN